MESSAYRKYLPFIIILLLLWCLCLNISRPRVETYSLAASEPEPLTNHEEQGTAFVFYATTDYYACSALVNVEILQNRLNTEHRIVALLGPEVPDFLVRAFEARGVKTVIKEPPKINEGYEYYQDVLLKLLAFQLHHDDPTLRKVMILDSDQLVMHSLDSLFNVPITTIAAPRAYWIDKAFFSSTLMVINLSDVLWKKVSKYIESIPRDFYDMDVVNDLFGSTVLMLPGEYATLNAHWENWDVPAWFTGEKELLKIDRKKMHPLQSQALMTGLYNAAKVIHFSAVAKPWQVNASEVRIERPDSHELLDEPFLDWWDIATDICLKAKDQ